MLNDEKKPGAEGQAGAPDQTSPNAAGEPGNAAPDDAKQPDEEKRPPEGKAPDAEKKPPEAAAVEAEASQPEEGAGETVQKESLPDILPVLPIRETVIFPVMVLPMHVTEKESLKLIDDVLLRNKMFVAVSCREGAEAQPPRPEDLYQMGTTCVILQMLKVPDGSVRILAQGLTRTAVEHYSATDPYLVAKVSHVSEQESDDFETTALFKNLSQQFLHMLGLMPNVSDEVKVAVMNISSPGRLADMIASNLNVKVPEKQDVLEELDVKSRLQKVTKLLSRETELVELAQKIQTQAKSEIDKGQREYYLRQQLKAIQEELGEADPHVEEVKDLRKRIEELKLPDEARKEADRELERLERMNPASAEYTVSRTYLDWVLALPWGKSTTDNLDLKQAKQVLEEDHYGLEKIKERVLEFLAVRKLRQDMRGSILCFVGPPGTGKTSIGKSIARAMGRRYVRISLGGVRDEAEIRGHRRTYIGALPGRIIVGLRKAGSNNPVFMLDEIDKLGADFRGDPSSALLEVLDPEQNNTFTDHYLDVPFDLTKVFFITTANILDPVPPALRDRMEVLEFPGYTAEEKLQIATRYLVPHQIEAHGLKDGQIKISNAAIERIISEYTREAGVRNLEREIASVSRKAAKKIAMEQARTLNVTEQAIPDLLGPPRFTSEVAQRTSEPGVSTGLAWTPAGGDIIFVEATRTPGTGKLILTGRLGDVMKESAQAALTHVRARAAQLKIPQTAFQKADFHIHVPAGAIPKDGPSAGVTIAMALVSLLTRRPIRSDVAMTGEITLRGRVMPVGGIKEKVLAAKRAGIETVILPKDNEKDLADVPPYAKAKLNFVLVEHVEEMLPTVFGAARPKKPASKKATRAKAAKKRKPAAPKTAKKRK